MFSDDFDSNKSEWTKKTRGIDFIEARKAWDDPSAVQGPANVVDGENRQLKVGKVDGKLWTIGFVYRNGLIRIFMARPPHDDEKEAYYD